MKKHSFFCSVAAALGLSVLLFALSACSDVKTSGSVSFSFKGSQLLSARNVALTQVDDTAFYLIISLRGDYTDSQALLVTEGAATYTITFDDVPVGSKVYAQANVYDAEIDSDYLHIWTGTSDTVTIASGATHIALTMKYMTADDSDWENDLSIQGIRGVSSASDDTAAYYFNGYSNGKYQVTTGVGSQPTVVSEGLWTKASENSIYVTECIYRKYQSDTYEMVTYPNAQYVTQETSNDGVKWFTVTSENGISIKFDSNGGRFTP